MSIFRRVNTTLLFVGCVVLLATQAGCDKGSKCTPSCEGKECGNDGCGGFCGDCGADLVCSADVCVDPANNNVVCRDLSGERTARPQGDVYVSKTGDDGNDGSSYETAYATVQRGVDVLEAGQTLIIGPGEYFESVQRGTFIDWEYANGLGNADVDTVIRAEIPGTVVIRGDVEAPAFEKLDGYQFVYVADVSGDATVNVVNELDTLQLIPKKGSLALLEFLPGGFYQDHAAGKLYLSTSDFAPASEHRYSFSMIQDHGLSLIDATRVTVEGLAVRGFNMGDAIFGWSDYTAYTVWGIYVTHSRQVTIRNCRTFFNAAGIGLTAGSDAGTYGGNLIDGCVSWANGSPVATEDTGGISLTAPYDDEVRNSVSYLNSKLGINIYGGDGEEVSGHPSLFSHNLSWGNPYGDYKIKTGESHEHHTDYSIGLGAFSHSTQPRSCLVGTSVEGASEDTIVLSAEESLDLSAEFADPENFDFRLQSTSRFRGRLGGGRDPGPNPFARNVFFVSTAGDDTQDGLSVSTAWRTFAHAAGQLDAGDTLYIEPGTYDESVVWLLQGTEAEPIALKGRGAGEVFLTGQWQLFESTHVQVERLAFSRLLRLDDSKAVSLTNNYFLAPDKGVLAANTVDLKVRHCTFTGFADAAVDLPCSVDARVAGNLFDNGQSPALTMRQSTAVLYSDYNSYTEPTAAWSIDDTVTTFEDLQSEREPSSQLLTPTFVQEAGSLPQLSNHLDFAFGGTYRRPFGVYRHTTPHPTLRLVKEATVHSVSATTANIEWIATHPTLAQLTYGDTEAMTESVQYAAQPFATFSLTGLTPNTTYHFRISSLEIHPDLELDSAPVTPSSTILTFTTLAADAAPQTYFVSTTGDDGNDGLTMGTAWRSIQHAADTVNVGDTVRIAGGRYYEQVYIRATGTAAAPITFANQPGEQVYLDGMEWIISNAFVIAGKSNLNFDGLYFHGHTDANRWSESFTPLSGGDFNIYESGDISITRCLFTAGDFQHTAIVSRNVENLTVENAAFFNHFVTLYLHHTENFVMNDSVIARPWIWSMINYADPATAARFNRVIFTDSFEMKAEQNIPLFYGGSEGFVQTDCVYVLRPAQPPEWRHLTDGETVDQAPGSYVNPLFTDPKFAAVEALIAGGYEAEFPADDLMHEDVVHNFDAFFATDPTVTARNIGLDPTRFNAQGIPE